MLYDTILHNPQRTDPGFDSAAFSGLMATAQRFVLSPDVVHAANQVARTKPSSIAPALPLARLPYDRVWLEWEARPFQESAGIASEKNRVTFREASGPDFLEAIREGVLLINLPDISCVHASIAWDQGREDPTGWMVSPLVMALFDDAKPMSNEQIARGTAAQFWDDPTEREAAVYLFRRFGIKQGAHPFYDKDRFAPKDLADYFPNWTGGAKMMFLIAVLLLLNSKNAVELEHVTHETLNKARAKRGKPPLSDYHVTHVRLGRAWRRAASAGGMSDYEMRAHWCRGHFKLRRTGVFWWSPHIRGHGKPVTRPHYQIGAAPTVLGNLTD